ncbi:hypothetical protein JCM3774_002968 [Rhodotorula dairenensis]
MATTPVAGTTVSDSRKRPRSRGSIFSSSSSSSPFSLVSSVLGLVRTSRETTQTNDANAAVSDLFVPANTDRAEQTYISSTAFSDLTFSVTDSHESRFPGDVGFRQVSNDPATPVFFISPPTLMYGYLAPESKRLWQSACSVLGPGAPQRLVEIYLSRSQPALPVLGMQTFAQTDPAELAEMGISYALLTSLIAHATSYIYEIRTVHKHLWRQVILPLEDEFRKPSFQTIQTAIVILTSRPAINVAQNHIAMGRVVTAAQLLGLHLDPSSWRVSASERSLRKRLWWTLLIHDKWRTLWYGRPRTISADDWSVPIPTLGDMELPENPTSAQQSSAESYLAWCSLTAFLDPLITDFYTVRTTLTSRPVEERLALLEKHGMRLRGFEAELPSELRDVPSSENKPSEPAASGVRSFQLCKLGVELTLLRLTTATFDRPSTTRVVNAARATIDLSHVLVEFLEQLLPPEFDMFWAPYCSFIISAAGAHLLRTAIAVGTLDATLRNTAGVLFARLVVTLTSSHHAAHWDVASLALDRIASLLRSLDGQLPELAPLLQLFGAPNHAPAATTAPRPATTTRAEHVSSPTFALPQQHSGNSATTSGAAAPAAMPPPLPSMLPPPRPPAASFLSPQQAPPAALPFLGHGGLDGSGRATRMPSPAEFAGTLSTTAAVPIHDSPPQAFLPSVTRPTAGPPQQYYSPRNPAPPPLPAPAQSLMAPSPPLSDQLDPLWWMNTDILSLPAHFGTLPDLFEQAFLLGPYYEGGDGGGGGATMDSDAELLYSHERDATNGNGSRSRAAIDEMERQKDHQLPGEEADSAAAAAPAARGIESEMTGLDAIATAATAVHPLVSLGTINGSHKPSSSPPTTATTTTTTTTSAAMMMIGADGLFDLRSFLEHGGGGGSGGGLRTTDSEDANSN